MGECEFSPYGEELPIGITRTREILECTRLIPDLGKIVAEYAQLTSRDKINILCAEYTGRIGLDTLGVDIDINWIEDSNSLTNAKIIWLSWPNKKIYSRPMDLSRFLWGERLSYSDSSNCQYLDSRFQICRFNKPRFIKALNVIAAKVL